MMILMIDVNRKGLLKIPVSQLLVRSKIGEVISRSPFPTPVSPNRQNNINFDIITRTTFLDYDACRSICPRWQKGIPVWRTPELNFINSGFRNCYCKRAPHFRLTRTSILEAFLEVCIQHEIHSRYFISLSALRPC
jgi:hypothetical protein